MKTTTLTVLAIVDAAPIVQLFSRVFSTPDDQVLIATTLAEGLSLAASVAPDLAFVDVSLGHNAGLALVHHLRAVAPNAPTGSCWRSRGWTGLECWAVDSWSVPCRRRR